MWLKNSERKFGENYWRCEILDRQKRRLISILNTKNNITSYKIIITQDSLDILIENIPKGKEDQMLEELKSLVRIFRSVAYFNENNDKKILKVTFSKGYDITDEEYGRSFYGKPVHVVSNRVGITIKYYKRALVPLIIYSYLINFADIGNFIKKPEKYIDILANASI